MVRQGVQWSSNYLREYQCTLNCIKVYDEKESATSLENWSSLPVGNLRFDVDASYNEDSCSYSVGGVVRNNDGNLLLVFGQNIFVFSWGVNYDT